MVKRSNPHHAKMNQIIATEKHRAQSLIYDAEVKGVKVNTEAILNRTVSDTIDAAFNSYIAGHAYHETQRKYKNILEKLKDFAPNESIRFSLPGYKNSRPHRNFFT